MTVNRQMSASKFKTRGEIPELASKLLPGNTLAFAIIEESQLTSREIQFVERAAALGEKLLVVVVAQKSETDTESDLGYAFATLKQVDWVVVCAPDDLEFLVTELKPTTCSLFPNEDNESPHWLADFLDVVKHANCVMVELETSNSSTTSDGLPKSTQDYLRDFFSRHSLESVLEYVHGTRKIKTLLIGETIIDEYVYCEAIGKSSKEPTLVVKQNRGELFAGGILAVANHMANFCDELEVVTVLGDHDNHVDLIEDKLNDRVKSSFLFRSNAPTIRKRRYIEQYHFHKLFEVYHINESSMLEAERRKLRDLIVERAKEYDAVVVFDFGHGMISPDIAQAISGLPNFLVLNTQANAGNLGYHSISKYNRADVVCITESELRLEARDRHNAVDSLARKQREKFGPVRLVVTRGSRGCLLCSNDPQSDYAEIPAVTERVVDRVGAGDGFLSLASLVARQKAPLEVIGMIGNVAGGLAAKIVGHRSSIEKDALISQIKSLHKQATGNSADDNPSI